MVEVGSEGSWSDCGAIICWTDWEASSIVSKYEFWAFHKPNTKTAIRIKMKIKTNRMLMQPVVQTQFFWIRFLLLSCFIKLYFCDLRLRINKTRHSILIWNLSGMDLEIKWSFTVLRPLVYTCDLPPAKPLYHWLRTFVSLGGRPKWSKFLRVQISVLSHILCMLRPCQ